MTVYQYVNNNTRSKFGLNWKIPVLVSSWLPAIVKFKKFDSFIWVILTFYSFFYIYQKIFFFQIYNKPVMISKDSLFITEKNIFRIFFMVIAIKSFYY